MTPAVPRLALTMEETAQSLGVTYRTVQDLIKRRLLRPSRALRKPLIPVSEIERFLKATTPEQTPL
jgi:excisionase family DNA binding protein